MPRQEIDETNGLPSFEPASEVMRKTNSRVIISIFFTRWDGRAEQRRRVSEMLAGREFDRWLTFTLSRTRFGNRYYENLNAEEEIPGVFFAFGRGVFSPFSLADIELLRPSSMGRPCSGERNSGRDRCSHAMYRWSHWCLSFSSTNTMHRRCRLSGTLGSRISAKIHQWRIRRCRDTVHPGNR